MSRTTSLITGGAGFIGSHLTERLSQLGHDTIVLDDLSGGLKENLSSSTKFYEGSITDHELVSEIFEKNKIDFVFHLAAYAAEGLSHFIRRFNYQNNLIGSVNLINESVKHEVKNFIFTSSVAVYGSGHPPFTEDQIPQPEDPYGVAKFAVEQDLKCAHEMFGLNYVIFRPHNVYGERQNIADKYRNVIGIFMNRLMNGQKLPIFGDGEQTRAFTYVHDIIDIMILSTTEVKMFNQVYNIGSDKFYSVNELASMVQKSLAIKGDVQYLNQRNEVTHAYCSHEKIKRDSPIQINETDMAQGLLNMAQWAKSVEVRPTKNFSQIEILKNLPPSWK